MRFSRTQHPVLRFTVVLLGLILIVSVFPDSARAKVDRTSRPAGPELIQIDEISEGSTGDPGDGVMGDPGDGDDKKLHADKWQINLSEEVRGKLLKYRRMLQINWLVIFEK